jgi:hypothetical protein
MDRMTLHYHGLPITPWDVFYTLAGRHFCVSFHRPDQVKQAHDVGQSVMLDNGAFSAFTKGKPVTDWSAYYAWCDRWLDYPTTWAVIPDEIDAGSQQQDALLRGMQLARCEWPFASVDSTDIGRNHNRAENTARAMADRWDAAQCPATWRGRETTKELFA